MFDPGVLNIRATEYVCIPLQNFPSLAPRVHASCEFILRITSRVQAKYTGSKEVLAPSAEGKLGAVSYTASE